MDDKLKQINQMLTIIMDSSHSMPDCVFQYYVDFKKKPEEKVFYNLIADSFLTLFSYCKLMFENAWSQAFTILRMGLEQVAAVFLLTNKPTALEKYIDLYKLKIQYSIIESKDDKKVFLLTHNIPKNRINAFFDYSWISSFTSDGKYGRNQMIELARLEEFLVDIERSLNAFSHGSMSVFEMNGDNWNVMKRYGIRASLTCCKLYDFLCCSYHNLIGTEEFAKLPLDRYFHSFKLIYRDLFMSEGWFKMTNYGSFPKHRKNGIVIKYKEYQYSWSENNPRQRKYLLESDYLDGAVEVYVWENNTTYTSIDDFKNYLRNKKDEGVCPLCGKPLVRRQSHSDYMNIFLGCSGWPECKFTKKA